MAWIESHQSLGTHRKLYQLARILRISRPQAVGHLHYLWWWALDNAPDGDLSGVSDETLADVSGFLDGRSHRFGVRFTSVCSLFANALRSTGWIDTDSKLHDWYDYAGKLIQAREKDRERHRKSIGTPSELLWNSIATVPNRTQPYPTPLSPPTSKNKQVIKEVYGEFKNVTLTAEEHEKLIERFGTQGATDWIQELSLAKASKGYKTKSDYATILAWERRRSQGGQIPKPPERKVRGMTEIV